ncbi:hypothetical protein EMPG_16332 [Blastomyces silverae]|uniref:F-box domain-containing protein n=1 Tax=Blastomyces silverae TaxID=2060906 RepID=A0A0H1BGA4_9EURO|nr:hypothetical protein EMPG_16332 [Blastomyces silverae]
MASLGSLAPEILLEIISHVTSASDLISLSLQCRKFSQLAAAKLQQIRPYHRIRLTLDQQVTNMYHSLMAILRNRSLGLYAELMEIDTPLPDRIPMSTQTVSSDEWDAEEHKLVVDVVREIDFYGGECRIAEDSWPIPSYLDGVVLCVLQGNQDLGDISFLSSIQQKGFAHSAAAIFPAICPNLKLLKLSNRTGSTVINILRLINGSTQTKCLRNLRHVSTFVQTRTQEHTILEFLASCHQLQSMETLSVEDLTVWRPRGTAYSQPPHDSTPMPDSNVSKIHLTRCNIPLELLAPIFKPPKALRELKYSARALFCAGKSSDCIDPSILGRHLQVHRSTLRILDLDLAQCARCSANSGFPVDDTTPASPGTASATQITSGELAMKREETGRPLTGASSIGSLHGFSALTHLSIGVSFLLGPDSDEVRFADYWEENYPEAEEQLKQQPWKYNSPLRPASPLPSPPSPSASPVSGPSTARRRLIDRLPPNLEYLCIRGYDHGKAGGRWTSLISELMDKKAACFPRLKEVAGVMEYIPSLAPAVFD